MHLTAAQKRFLRRHFVDGRLRYAARPAYALVVSLELAAQRALDTARPARHERDAELLGRLTAVVKTFERPAALGRLLADRPGTLPARWKCPKRRYTR